MVTTPTVKMLLLHTKAPLHCMSPRLPPPTPKKKEKKRLWVSTGQNWGWRWLCSGCACCRCSALRLPLLLSDCQSCCQTASPTVAEFWLTSSELDKDSKRPWLRTEAGGCCVVDVPAADVLLSDSQPHSGWVLIVQFWTWYRGYGSGLRPEVAV